MNQYLVHSYEPERQGAVVYAPNENQAQRLYRKEFSLARTVKLTCEVAARNCGGVARVVPTEVILSVESSGNGR